MKFLGIDEGKTNENLTPVGKTLSNKDLDGMPKKYSWEYHGAIGLLTCEQGASEQTLQWQFTNAHVLLQIQCILITKLQCALDVAFSLCKTKAWRPHQTPQKILTCI